MPLDLEVTVEKELEDIVPIFMENRRKDIAELEELVPQMEIEKIQNIAHKLAGNAGSYGFHELGKLGFALEEACVQGATDKIKAYCEDYKHFINNVTIKYA